MGKAERSQFAGGVQVCVGECRPEFMTKTSKYYYFVVSSSPGSSLFQRWLQHGCCSWSPASAQSFPLRGVIAVGIYRHRAHKHRSTSLSVPPPLPPPVPAPVTSTQLSLVCQRHPIIYLRLRGHKKASFNTRPQSCLYMSPRHVCIYMGHLISGPWQVCATLAELTCCNHFPIMLSFYAPLSILYIH